MFGFMNARIQTWFPFSIQICLKGREWLARQSDVPFVRERSEPGLPVSRGRGRKLVRGGLLRPVIHFASDALLVPFRAQG